MYILPQYLANHAKLPKTIGHIERYGLMAVVRILTALLLSSLNDLQFSKFVVLLHVYALLEFSRAKHKCDSRHLFPYSRFSKPMISSKTMTNFAWKVSKKVS